MIHDDALHVSPSFPAVTMEHHARQRRIRERAAAPDPDPFFLRRYGDGIAGIARLAAASIRPPLRAAR
jgi:hypothetical protein